MLKNHSRLFKTLFNKYRGILITLNNQKVYIFLGQNHLCNKTHIIFKVNFCSKKRKKETLSQTEFKEYLDNWVSLF